jgi:hypothetical protein
MDRLWLAFCCLAAALAYLPIVNNGFIADDYAILKRVEFLKTQPTYLLQEPPENFRSVSYVVFGALKSLAGYQAWPFYLFNIGLHLANIVLLWSLLRLVVGDQTTIRLSVLLFAVFQAPQEAIMWLAAMNETTLAFFAFLTLILWLRKEYVWATLAYTVALFSKESAVIIPVLAVLLDLCKEKQIHWRRYLLLAIPSGGFLAIFLITVSENFMLSTRSYVLGPQAVLVLGITLHRLLWPWFYIIIAAVWLKMRRWPSWSSVGVCLGFVIVTMLPYMFIAYQTSLPSRQLYLASAALMTMFGMLLANLRGTSLMNVVIAAFLIFNIGYLWFRKDAQFEERAAPTTQLLNALRQHRPQRTIIKNFAYPLPKIASSAALAVPGWNSGFVSTTDEGVDCAKCLRLEWDAQARRYVVGEHP